MGLQVFFKKSNTSANDEPPYRFGGETPAQIFVQALLSMAHSF
jgi:hypothetical protein